MLIASNISKSFGSKSVLKNISLTLNRGEVTVLLGESGCGKTTLLRVLAMLDKADAGTISVGNDRFDFSQKNNPSIKTIYPAVTVVFQQLFLWPHLTNRENILLAVGNNKSILEDKVRYLEQYLAPSMELHEFLDRYPNQSSSGQKQRIAVARALILQPNFLLLDEITASLDNIQTNKIVDIIKSAKSESNIGVLFITHNTQVAKDIGDKFAFISNGTLEEYGDGETLINPKSALFRKYLNGVIT